MEKESVYSRGMRDTIQTHEVTGRTVYSVQLKEIGKVKEVCLDKKTLEFRGFVIHRGLIVPDLYVSKDYIQGIEPESVLLKMVPHTEYPGMRVVDAEGIELGVVKEVEPNGEKNPTYFVVVNEDKEFKEWIIENDFVDSIGESIVLKKKRVELERQG